MKVSEMNDTWLIKSSSNSRIRERERCNVPGQLIAIFINNNSRAPLCSKVLCTRRSELNEKQQNNHRAACEITLLHSLEPANHPFLRIWHTTSPTHRSQQLVSSPRTSSCQWLEAVREYFSTLRSFNRIMVFWSSEMCNAKERWRTHTLAHRKLSLDFFEWDVIT